MIVKYLVNGTNKRAELIVVGPLEVRILDKSNIYNITWYC